MENPKLETMNAYNSNINFWEEKFKSSFEKIIKPQADIFLNYLPGKRILDVGAGPGLHSAYFKNKGYEPLCIDNSKEMIKLCLEKNIESYVMDMENPLFLPESFDGVWAWASLLHLKKDKFTPTVRTLATLLKPRGVFAIAIKTGNCEGFEEKPIVGEEKRWFSYYSIEEVKNAFSDKFEIVYEKTEFREGYDPFIKMFFKLKN